MNGCPEVFAKLPYMSLGLEKISLSFRLSILFPGFSQACACALPLSNLFPGFSRDRPLPLSIFCPILTGFVLPYFMVAVLAPPCACLQDLLLLCMHSASGTKPLTFWGVCKAVFPACVNRQDVLHLGWNNAGDSPVRLFHSLSPLVNHLTNCLF